MTKPSPKDCHHHPQQQQQQHRHHHPIRGRTSSSSTRTVLGPTTQHLSAINHIPTNSHPPTTITHRQDPFKPILYPSDRSTPTSPTSDQKPSIGGLSAIQQHHHHLPSRPGPGTPTILLDRVFIPLSPTEDPLILKVSSSPQPIPPSSFVISNHHHQSPTRSGDHRNPSEHHQPTPPLHSSTQQQPTPSSTHHHHHHHHDHQPTPNSSDSIIQTSSSTTHPRSSILNDPHSIIQSNPTIPSQTTNPSHPLDHQVHPLPHNPSRSIAHPPGSIKLPPPLPEDHPISLIGSLYPSSLNNLEKLTTISHLSEPQLQSNSFISTTIDPPSPDSSHSGFSTPMAVNEPQRSPTQDVNLISFSSPPLSAHSQPLITPSLPTTTSKSSFKATSLAIPPQSSLLPPTPTRRSNYSYQSASPSFRHTSKSVSRSPSVLRSPQKSRPALRSSDQPSVPTPRSQCHLLSQSISSTNTIHQTQQSSVVMSLTKPSSPPPNELFSPTSPDSFTLSNFENRNTDDSNVHPATPPKPRTWDDDNSFHAFELEHCKLGVDFVITCDDQENRYFQSNRLEKKKKPKLSMGHVEIVMSELEKTRLKNGQPLNRIFRCPASHSDHAMTADELTDEAQSSTSTNDASSSESISTLNQRAILLADSHHPTAPSDQSSTPIDRINDLDRDNPSRSSIGSLGRSIMNSNPLTIDSSSSTPKQGHLSTTNSAANPQTDLSRPLIEIVDSENESSLEAGQEHDPHAAQETLPLEESAHPPSSRPMSSVVHQTSTCHQPSSLSSNSFERVSLGGFIRASQDCGNGACNCYESIAIKHQTSIVQSEVGDTQSSQGRQPSKEIQVHTDHGFEHETIPHSHSSENQDHKDDHHDQVNESLTKDQEEDQSGQSDYTVIHSCSSIPQLSVAANHPCYPIVTASPVPPSRKLESSGILQSSSRHISHFPPQPNDCRQLSPVSDFHDVDHSASHGELTLVKSVARDLKHLTSTPCGILQSPSPFPPARPSRTSRASSINSSNCTLPLVEIASTDPKVAARAAAILSVHHGFIPRGCKAESSSMIDADLEREMESSIRKQLKTASEFSITRQNSLASSISRNVLQSLPTQAILNDRHHRRDRPCSSSHDHIALANSSIVKDDDDPHEPHRSSTHAQRLSTPSSRSSRADGHHNRKSKKTLKEELEEISYRPNYHSWTSTDWKILEFCLRSTERDYRMIGIVDSPHQSSSETTHNPSALVVSPEDVVLKLLQSLELEASDCRLEWEWSKMVHRVMALQKRRSGKRHQPFSMVTSTRYLAHHSDLRNPSTSSAASSLMKVGRRITHDRLDLVQEDVTNHIDEQNDQQVTLYPSLAPIQRMFSKTGAGLISINGQAEGKRPRREEEAINNSDEGVEGQLKNDGGIDIKQEIDSLNKHHQRYYYDDLPKPPPPPTISKDSKKKFWMEIQKIWNLKKNRIRRFGHGKIWQIINLLEDQIDANLNSLLDSNIHSFNHFPYNNNYYPLKRSRLNSSSPTSSITSKKFKKS